MSQILDCLHGNLNAQWVQGVAVHGGGWLVVVVVAIWLLLGDPLLGKAAYVRFLGALKSGGEASVRARFYKNWIWQGWSLALLVLALAIGVLGWSPAQLGLRLPQLAVALPGSFLAGALVAIPVGIALGVIIARRQKRLADSAAAPRVVPANNAMQLLPRDPSERRWFALLSLTAGVTEELVWRGFGLALLVAVFPQVPLIVDVVILAAAFGWAHVYQGAAGVFATALLGAVLAALYLATGSLLLPIVLHVLIDLAAMLRVPLEKSRAPKSVGRP